MSSPIIKLNYRRIQSSGKDSPSPYHAPRGIGRYPSRINIPSLTPK
ncbi:BgTH12-05919 [Blumeria graminis f. sp. triticale]|nr:BgTH12-05919 [Blumeria graminis f. sp. triticale]